MGKPRQSLPEDVVITRSDPDFPRLLGMGICAISRYFIGQYDALPPPGGALEGRSKLDPVYVATTEHRDGPGDAQRARYSSCGDQLHAILARLGIDAPWVNRGPRYRVGQNIALLQPPSCPAAHWAHPHEIPPPGSLCLIWTSGNDAHALVVLGPGSDANHLLTANYGAGGMSSSTRPGCNLADSPLTNDAKGYWHIGGSHRQLHSVITPASLIPFLGQIDLTDCRVTGELIDALGARYDQPEHSNG